jgi:Xaa-Pro aminopeptidase
VLEEGMVLTVEPGLYFNEYQIDKGLNNPDQAQYLVKDRLNAMRTFGGARIEDMVRAMKELREARRRSISEHIAPRDFLACLRPILNNSRI